MTPGRVGLVGRLVLVELVVLLVVLLVLLVVLLLEVLLVVVLLVGLVEEELDVVDAEELTLVDEVLGGFNKELCVIAVSDLKVGVGVSGTAVVGKTPAVRSAFPLPLCPSIAKAMYWCVPSSRPISAQALQWLPVLMVPPQCMLVRTDQYCSKSVLSPSMLGALVRFFCQTS